MALALLPISVQAQSGETLRRSFKREIARWELQQASAEKDAKLTEKVHVAFLVAAKPLMGAATPESVNAALAPLKARYPDFRLNYRSERDYCSIRRALNDARVSALRRSSDALQKQNGLLLLEATWSSVLVKMRAERILGRNMNEDDVAEAFEWGLSTAASGEVEVTWNSMDYQGEDLGTGDGCD
jgi:hypothetical protein